MMYRKRASGSFLQAQGGLRELIVLMHMSTRLAGGRKHQSGSLPQVPEGYSCSVQALWPCCAACPVGGAAGV